MSLISQSSWCWYSTRYIWSPPPGDFTCSWQLPALPVTQLVFKPGIRERRNMIIDWVGKVWFR